MQEDDDQRCQDVDETGFCDLMFLMEREGHAVKQEEAYTQLTGNRILSASS
jgi:hypothetical protein